MEATFRRKMFNRKVGKHAADRVEQAFRNLADSPGKDEEPAPKELEETQFSDKATKEENSVPVPHVEKD